MSDTRTRFWSFLNAALVLGAVTAVLLALGIVVALVWWIPSASQPAVQPVARPQVRAAPHAPLPPGPAPVVQPPRLPVAPQPPARPAPVEVAAERLAAAPPPPVAPTPAATRGPNSDAAKNRAIGAALLRLAEDPEMQRKLGAGVTPAPP